MFYTAFVLGLIGSFHCIGMCGPIAFVLPLDKEKPLKAFGGTVLYHLGRLISYGVIGLLFGMIGKGLYLAGFQQRLSILIGVLMIVLVLVPARTLNRFSFTRPLYGMINRIKKSLGLYLNRRSAWSLLPIGILNGFLPCGLVYMALLGSVSTGAALPGAVYMTLFGLGTIPMMTAAVFLGNFLKISVRNKIQKAIPIFVVIVGLLFILRGMGLGIPYISPSDTRLIISNDPNTCVTE